MTHTLRPWTAKQLPNSEPEWENWEVWSDGGLILAQRLSESDARLIAAAPAMLEALRGIQVWHPNGDLCFCNGGRKRYGKHQDKCIEARAAISLATGEPK